MSNERFENVKECRKKNFLKTFKTCSILVRASIKDHPPMTILATAHLPTTTFNQLSHPFQPPRPANKTTNYPNQPTFSVKLWALVVAASVRRAWEERRHPPRNTFLRVLLSPMPTISSCDEERSDKSAPTWKRKKKNDNCVHRAATTITSSSRTRS